MQKLILKNLCGGRPDHYLRGVKESVTWIPTSWDGGPEGSGEYFVSDGKGEVFKLKHVRSTEDCQQLFDDIVHGYNTYVKDANNNQLTGDDLIEQLYCGFDVWYDVEYYETDYGCSHDTFYTIYTGDDVPKYYMECKFQGPVDDDLDSYEEILVDRNLNIITNS